MQENSQLQIWLIPIFDSISIWFVLISYCDSLRTYSFCFTTMKIIYSFLLFSINSLFLLKFLQMEYH